MRKKELKSKTGITLIALVVTIVVLLILAGITINLVFAEGGILQKAKDADNIHKEAVNTDWDAINDITSKINELVDGTGSTGVRTLVELYDAGELKIGDYVNYKNPTTGIYVCTPDKSGLEEKAKEDEDGNYNQIFDVSKNQVKWRVLGKDTTTGGIKLVADCPVKMEGNETIDELLKGTRNDSLCLAWNGGILHGVEELNNIGALYKNNLASSARSINLQDINEITGVTTEEKIKEVDNLSSFIGIEYGQSFTTEGYTPSSYLNNEKVTISERVTSYMYGVAPEDVDTDGLDNAESIVKISREIYDMLFNVNTGTINKYWLADVTIGYNPGEGWAIWTIGQVVTMTEGEVMLSLVTHPEISECSFGSNGYRVGNAGPVLPVVILKPTVTENEIKKVDNKIE